MPHSETGGPLVKRQKRDELDRPRPETTTTAAFAEGSKIFAPFRTVGLVSPTSVPFTSYPLGKTSFQITTSVGRALQTYDLKRGLSLVFVTRPQTPRDITATYSWKNKVFAAWGGEADDAENDNDDSDDNDEPPRRGIWVFRRGRKVGEVPMPADLHEPIRQLLVFGSWLVGLARTRVEVWKSATFEHYTTLQPAGGQKVELTGGMCTMPTFLNKLFVGRADGWVEIWNVSSGKLVYTLVPPPDCGAVTCLEPTPALCLLAIAYAAGPLIIHDVLRDKTLLALDAGSADGSGSGAGDDSNDAPVCSISFRTDGRGAGLDGRIEGVMATATAATGDVTFWDLNGGGRIMGVLRSAHNPPARATEDSSSSNGSEAVRGGISKVEFLPGQPVLVTSGLDNALKSWIFDETPFSPVPRILHTRSGHAAPVNCLDFLPSDFDGPDAGNKWLLSGGRDRSLWGWSLRRDGQSTELSQGHLRQKAKKVGILSASVLRHGPTTTLDDLKAPEITAIASSLNRDGGIGALPGKQPVWLKVDPRNKNNGASGGSSAAARKGSRDAESSAMTGWESVVTAHKGDAWARTWFWGRKRAGRWALPTGDRAPVSAVAISPCGSFALVGSEHGAIDMYNLQSGLHRQRFPSMLTPAQARQLKVQLQLRQADSVTQLQALGAGAGFLPGTGRHTKAVTGLVVDNMDKYVVSCSLDGTVKVWDFLTGHLIDQIVWGTDANPIAITACRYHAANDLLAFACDDSTIRVVDLETRRTIRVFRAGSPPPPPPPPSSSSSSFSKEALASNINDFCFSNDGRWIVAVTRADARLRVWDLPTSHLIDSVVLERPGHALSFSGTGEFLAVAPEGALGVHIWTNKTLFKHVPTRPVIESAPSSAARPKVVAAPTASGEGGTGLIEAAFEETPAEDAEADVDDASNEIALASRNALDQLSADLTTLSLVPRSRWQTLLHLDVIKARNKPKEAPKAPEKAPFFLGTVGSADAEAALAFGPAGGGGGGAGGDGSNTSQQQAAGHSRILTLDHTRAQQAFTRKLHEGGASEEFEPFVEHLKQLPPAQADLELRSLAPEQDELALFVRAMTSRLRARRDYELVQAWMAVLLRLHGSTVGGDDATGDAAADWERSFASALVEWRAVQEQERQRLDALVGYCGGVIGFLRSPRT